MLLEYSHRCTKSQFCTLNINRFGSGFLPRLSIHQLSRLLPPVTVLVQRGELGAQRVSKPTLTIFLGEHHIMLNIPDP